MTLWNSFYIYKKNVLSKKDILLIIWLSEIVRRLIHLPTDIINGHQLVKKDKRIISTSSNIPGHPQEKIYHYQKVIWVFYNNNHAFNFVLFYVIGWSRGTYFLSCRECYKKKSEKIRLGGAKIVNQILHYAHGRALQITTYELRKL